MCVYHFIMKEIAYSNIYAYSDKTHKLTCLFCSLENT